MPRVLCGLLVLGAFCGFSNLSAQESGTLQKVREEVSEEPEPCPKRPRKTCDFGDWGCNELATLFITAPFTLPHCLLGDDFQVPGHFLAYPYVASQPGYMSVNQYVYAPADAKHEQAKPPRLRTWSSRLAIDESNDFHRRPDAVALGVVWRLRLPSHRQSGSARSRPGHARVVLGVG